MASDGVGGDAAFFLLLDEPEAYGLPPDPVVTTRDLPAMWRHVGLAAGAMVAGVAAGHPQEVAVSRSEVTREGLRGIRPGREAVSSYSTPRRGGRRRGGEQPTVPEADFRAYYGEPVLNKPVWSSPDIPGYLYLGGLSGSSALLAAAASLAGQKELARVAKAGSAASIGASLVALVHDLGRPGS